MIRQAIIKEDVKRIYDIVFNEEVLPFMPYPNMSLEQFQSELQKRSDRTFLYVYETAKEISGVVELRKGENKQNHIGHVAVFAVHPDFQNKGIGSEMMKHLLSITHDYGIKKLCLNVVSKNQRAIDFYKKFGFLIEGYFRRQIKENGSYGDLIAFSYLLE